VVDEAALIAALEAGRIAGAGLDVYEREPEVPERLRALENAVLLPHLGTAALEVREAMGLMAVENLMAFLKEQGGRQRQGDGGETCDRQKRRDTDGGERREAVFHLVRGKAAKGEAQGERGRCEAREDRAAAAHRLHEDRGPVLRPGLLERAERGHEPQKERHAREARPIAARRSGLARLVPARAPFDRGHDEEARRDGRKDRREGGALGAQPARRGAREQHGEGKDGVGPVEEPGIAHRLAPVPRQSDS
jgi:hypothetical protein